MYRHKFKYYLNPEANAEFTEEACQFCGATVNCLEGEYFDRGDEVTSVCFDCLIDGKTVVNIPEYLQEKLYSHLKDVHSEKNVDINNLFKSIIADIERNPPVPWIQFNDWPIHNGDFLQYIGEWGQEEFNNASPVGNGKEFVLSILNEETKSKIDDDDVFWEDIGNYTAIFVFKCINGNKMMGVAQSY